MTIFKFKTPKKLVVGGTWGAEPRKSKIALQLSKALDAETAHTGDLDNLEKYRKTVPDYDLTVWMPNIIGDVEKKYPAKSVGSILICSKIMRKDYTSIDSVSRIFKMHANAVIEIHPTEGRHYHFKLIDALGNCWVDSYQIEALAHGIKLIAEWTNRAIRQPTMRSTRTQLPEHHGLDKLCQIAHSIADKVQNDVGNRYFGNISTRCMKTFPSMRGIEEKKFYVSARNVDKSRITNKDMVFVHEEEDGLYYVGEKKPSIDTPVQIAIYNQFPEINYMLHGHAYIQDLGIPTDSYYPCGDLREVPEITKRITYPDSHINLVNHGFLMYSNNIEKLEKMARNVSFHWHSNKKPNE